MDVNRRGRLPRPAGTYRKYTLFIGGFITVLGCALYQAIISPIINPEPWKEIREKLYDQLPKPEKQD